MIPREVLNSLKYNSKIPLQAISKTNTQQDKEKQENHQATKLSGQDSSSYDQVNQKTEVSL